MMENDYWKNRRVLVTGGQGFLGGNLIKYLVSQGSIVTTICHRFPKDDILFYYGLGGKLNVEIGDINEYGFIKRVITENQIQDIFHFAAISIVSVAASDPINCLKTNIMGTVKVLEASRSYEKIESLVCFSSDKSYGISKILPYTEDMPLNGMSVYEASKSCTDIIVRMYAKNYGLNAVVARCCNIFGGGDFNFSRIVPNNIIRRLSGDKVLIYADVHNYIREYIYIEDVMRACLCLSEQILLSKGEAYNIGTGEYIKNIDFMKLLCKYVDEYLGGENKEIEIDSPVREKYFKEIEVQYLDSRKINQLGWKPEYNLKRGLQKTIEWYADYLKNIYGWDIGNTKKEE